MKFSSFLFAIALLSGFSATAFPQDRWHVEIQGGRTIAGLIQTSLNSNGGWNVGAGVGYDLTEGVQLMAHGTYHSFGFAPNNLPLAGPIVAPDVYIGTIPGYPLTITGERSKLYEGALEFRVISTRSVIEPYLSIQSGLYLLEIGRVEIAGSAAIARPADQTSLGVYEGTGESVVRGFASMGMGLNIPFGDRVSIAIQGSYARTFQGDYVFVPISSIVALRFD